MSTVAISILGQKKDYWDRRNAVNKNEARLIETWRPSVALAAQKKINIDEYHLICQPQQREIAKTVVNGIKHFSPKTEVHIDVLNFKDVFDFQTTYLELMKYTCQPCFHRQDTDYFIHLTTGTHVEQICLFLLTQKHYFNGKLIQTYQDDKKLNSDPVGHTTIIDLNLSAYDKLKQYFKAEEDKSIRSLKAGINTKNNGYNKTIDEIEAVIARDTSPILLTGPTGSGKTVLAKRIYEQYKARSLVTGKFISLNCAAIPSTLAESEIFGHAKGAYTDAHKDFRGKIEQADGGILFLDEIGELPLDVQAKLLKVLEEHTFTRVGGEETLTSNFILISGTNRDLEADVANHRFRDDLLQRINLWTFRMPGLAERREDIPPNIDHELSRFEKETKNHIEFNKEGRDAFLEYALAPTTKWEGNFREFRSMLHRMAVFADCGIITEEIARNEIQRTRNTNPCATPDQSLEQILGPDYPSRIDPIDAVQLKYAIDICLQAKTAAAAGRALFAATLAQGKKTNPTSRITQYLERFGLTIDYSAVPPRISTADETKG